jgi:hypothetical protein
LLGDSLQTHPPRDRRNSTNHAPATKNRKPGLVPGFFVSVIRAFNIDTEMGAINESKGLAASPREIMLRDMSAEI